MFTNPLNNQASFGGTVGINVSSNVVSEEILMEDEVSFLHYFAHMSATLKNSCHAIVASSGNCRRDFTFGIFTT